MNAKTTPLWQEPLRRFVWRVWDNEHVEQRCLTLQDEYHANVNILLWTCWLQKEGLLLWTEWLDEVLIQLDTQSQLTVGRLREVRRLLRDDKELEEARSTAVRGAILRAEIELEKHFLQRLESMTLKFHSAQQRNTLPGASLDTVYYLDFLRIPEAASHADALCRDCGIA